MLFTGRLMRLMLHPAKEWRAIAAEHPSPRRLLMRHVLPLACVPALAWAAGLAMFGLFESHGQAARVLPLGRIAHIAAVTFAGSVITVALVAGAIWLIAPMYSAARDWRRALQVAAYAGSPVFLTSVVLVVPMAVFLVVLALGHAAYFMYLGLQAVLSVREGDAAEYVAIVCLAVIAASTFLGGIGGTTGLL